MNRKVIALVMTIAMAFTMMPIMGAPVYADDPAPAAPGIAIGSDVLSIGSNRSGAATVHMANKAWRVIGYGESSAEKPQVASSADTMTLLADGILKKDVVFREYIRDEGSDSWYHQSILQSEVEAIANTFSDGEKAGIAARNLRAGDYNGYDTDTVSRYSVSNALLWPLSTKEAHYTLNEDIRNVNDFWWLRSPGNTAPPYFTCHISYVKSDGNVDEEGCLVTEKNGVRPAFNYKLASVILTSAADGGKTSGTIGADALVQVGNNATNEWKLTVKNGHDDFKVDSVTTCDKKTLNIKYSGATTRSNEYISAIVKDKDGKVTFYGNLKNCAAEGDASGTVTVKVENKLEADDTLYVFNEQLNGEKKTDLASELKEVTIPETITHEMTHHDAVAPKCTEDGNVEYWSCGNCNKNFGDEQGNTELTTTVDPKGHKMTHHDAVAPKCTEDGTVEYWSCGNCSKNFGDEQGTTELATIVDQKTGHEMTHHDAALPTCTDDGTVEYWSCGKCSKNFGDEQGTEELTTTVNPKTGHKYGDWTKLDDKQHQKVCEHDATHVEKANHTWDSGKVTKAATEQAEGVKTYTCSVCKATKTEPIPKTGPKQEPGSDPNQKGSDGTAFGKGASAAAAEKAITSMKSDGDPKGTVYSSLKFRSTKQTTKSMTLRWSKVKNAKTYVLYGNKCGKKNKMKRIGTYKKTTLNLKKAAGKKLKKATYYKLILIALDKNNNVVSSSKVILVATKGSNKKANPTGVTVKAKISKTGKTLKKYTKTSAIALKKGKATKLKAGITKAKKTKVQLHRKVIFESSNAKIAKVTKAGKVKAVRKGTCFIYAYAQDGKAKRIKVKVK